MSRSLENLLTVGGGLLTAAGMLNLFLAPYDYAAGLPTGLSAPPFVSDTYHFLTGDTVPKGSAVFVRGAIITPLGALLLGTGLYSKLSRM